MVMLAMILRTMETACMGKSKVLTVLFLFTVFVQAFADAKTFFSKDGFTYSILRYGVFVLFVICY